MGRLDVPKYFRVSGRFWFDERAAKWPDDLKLFALYILTNQHRTMEGIFVLPIPYMAADLRWPTKKIDHMMAALRDEEFISYDLDTSTILIRNALKYQSPENPNQSEACLRRIKELPKSSIVTEFQAMARKHCYRKGASASAQAFAQLLDKLLLEHFHEQLYPAGSTLNLESSSSPEPKTKSSSSPPLSSGVSLREMREERLAPHLRATEDVSSVRQLSEEYFGKTLQEAADG
ncbi:protein of unknown function [Nitrospira defluvii]|jgi:hypothetical protein|uniref:Uncharacterized protein n=1 Tax=Nitrospira defluvii TaxID=330214 RepID=D8P827_9BACT|nr:protein of unknown function [Nitrospira defluvii]